MPMNTYADISGYVQTIFEDAMFVARETSIMAPLVQGFDDAQGDNPRTNSNYGTVTMQSLSETDDMASQAFTPSTYNTLTPGEAGGQVFLVDRRIDNDPFGARADAAQELGASMAAKIETDLIGDFTTLTGGTVGAGGSPTSWGMIFAAETILRAKLAPGRLRCVMSPYQWFNLGTAVNVVGAGPARNAPNFQDRVNDQGQLASGYVFSHGNIDFYTSAWIASGTAVTAAMFAAPAIALDTRRAPRLEPERDASRRGWELNVSAVYAHGKWRPEWGVQILSSGTVPNGF